MNSDQRPRRTGAAFLLSQPLRVPHLQGVGHIDHNAYLYIMRIAYTLILLAFVVCSCNNASEQKKPAKPVAPPHATVAEYKAFLDGLDTVTVGNATLAAEQFKKLFNTRDTFRNDSAFCLFVEYHQRLIHGLNETSVFDTILESGIEDISLDSPDAVLPALEAPFAALRKNGFQLDQVEDFIAIVPDSSFIAKNFYPHLSMPMRKFLQKVSHENEEGTEEDGGLIITATQVADRALWWEWFTTAYPVFALGESAKEYRQFYLTCLLRGLDNTPVLDPYTKAADTNFVRAYQYILDKHGNTQTAKYIGPYYEAIMDNNRLRIDTILTQYQMQDITLW